MRVRLGRRRSQSTSKLARPQWVVFTVGPEEWVLDGIEEILARSSNHIYMGREWRGIPDYTEACLYRIKKKTELPTDLRRENGLGRRVKVLFCS